MRRSSTRIAGFEPAEVDGALAALGAEDLRAIIREIVPWLDERICAQLANAVIDRATRSGSGWSPAGPSDERVKEITVFAEGARKAGCAEPSAVDHHLRQGSNAFLSKDYGAAYRIFHTLLVPIADGGIDLGQHEMLDEVLGVDVGTCAGQYVVSAYMTAAPARRAVAVRAAIKKVRSEGYFFRGPLREMERIAVEPLPGFEDFLLYWRALLQKDIDAARQDAVDNDRRGRGDTDKEGWLREVVHRVGGATGLAELARSTKGTDDLREWCRVLAAARDWASALSACEEAAEITAGDQYARGEFLDGAALAARELCREDSSAYLERAWRASPTMARLLRWLGFFDCGAVVKTWAVEALDACPQAAHGQRALLHIVRGDLEPAAALLAEAPGLGWSGGDHPGHVVFPCFYNLLGGGHLTTEVSAWASPYSAATGSEFDAADRDTDKDDAPLSSTDEPRLHTPAFDEVLARAGVSGPASVGTGGVAPGTMRAETGGVMPGAMRAETRGVVLGAMRTAAEKRLAGVVEHSRRRTYRHAAWLAKACVVVDPTPEARAWIEAIREAYRRYPALRRELAD